MTPPPVVVDPDVLSPYLEDASSSPAGTAAGLVRPADEREAAAVLRQSAGRGVSILPQAARSSLTGGATPQGEIVVSIEQLVACGPVQRHDGGGRQTVGAGVRLSRLERALAASGLYFPPVPTHREAMLGGTASTNAGGAASFKYGVTRDWVVGLRVLLANGDLLDLTRGQTQARPGESFRITLSDGETVEVPVPTHRLPRLRKISAGYFAADPLDLVDLFVGAEGTLGLITAVTVDLVPLPPALLTGLVFTPDRFAALALAADLRDAALAARERGAASGVDVRSIEYLDGACLALLREHGDARRLRVELPPSAGAALLFEVELDRPTTDDEAQRSVAAWVEGSARRDDAMGRLLGRIDKHGALDGLELAFPEDERRHRTLLELREAAPRRVSELLAQRRRAAPGVRKVGGDMIVPFDRMGELLELCEGSFGRRGLQAAVWGHLSDGNLHPNVLPSDGAGTRAGRAALLELGAEATRLGGCPLSEHGVGRSGLKQELLRRFLGDPAIEGMRRVKRALDPEWRFAPGVLFPRTVPCISDGSRG